MLILLQEQGRTTTAALAARLEVSRRTVLRDVAALSEAGVPVVTFAGPGGGVELMDRWRTTVGGLTAEHASGLMLAGQPLLARAVGMSAQAGAARTALLSMLPDGVREEAVAMEHWLVVDPEPAAGHTVGAQFLQDAARACREGLELEVTTADGARVLRAARLVLRGGRWWLESTAAGPADPGLLALDLVRTHRLRPSVSATTRDDRL